MEKFNRNSGNQALDSGAIANQSYNEAAGVHKVAQAGLKLKPLPLTAVTFTTDASTARKLPEKGMTLAIYNNAGAVGAFRLSKAAAPSALAAGVVDNSVGDGFGDVGVPVPPNSWHYTNSFDAATIITSAATMLVFLVEDESRLTPKA
jgi:hypothetical protein